MSDAAALIVADDGCIRHLIFNRPERLNAIDLPQHERVIDAIEDATNDRRIKVIALSGEGRAFCAGDDMKSRTPWPERWRHRAVDLDIGIGPALLLEATDTLRRCPKATVALMHGYALGAGYDYSLSCDFRLATADCRYGDPRINRAMWAAEGWSYKLPRQIPLGYVPEIAYLGELMSAERAFEVGLLHGVLPAGKPIRESAQPFLERVGNLDATSYRITKTKLNVELDMSYETALHHLPA